MKTTTRKYEKSDFNDVVKLMEEFQDIFIDMDHHVMP